ncbi:hypothetical protein [Hungatella hathewayi]|uniref:hypothetical protein n=1 Tax=Hungatella hathewayi TaxID=154046 RepID=UPI0035627EBD
MFEKECGAASMMSAIGIDPITASGMPVAYFLRAADTMGWIGSYLSTKFTETPFQPMPVLL